MYAFVCPLIRLPVCCLEVGAVIFACIQDETKHYIVAEKRFHLFDILRAVCAADNYKLKTVLQETVVAEVELEMCFGWVPLSGI
jgi:hypothetical protein